MKQPNVIIFCADQLRADHIACMDNSIVQTPNIDRIATNGTIFRQGYCNNPVCMPARSTMFTGLLPRDHGVRMNGHYLRPDIPTLPKVLLDHGYQTHAAGKLHLTPWVPQIEPPEPQKYPECLHYWNNGDIKKFPTPYYGFKSVDFVGGHTSFIYGPYLQWIQDCGGNPQDIFPKEDGADSFKTPGAYRITLPEELHYNRYIADSTIDIIRDSASEDKPPFFCWCSFPDPHPPLATPAPYHSMYNPNDIPLPVRRKGEYDRLPSVFKALHCGKINPYNSCLKDVTDTQWQEMIALTYGMITHMDVEIGRVIDALVETGQDANTIIAVVSDHGDMMGDHQLMLKSFYTFRGCINVPFILSVPNMPKGRITDALISHIDLMPSILDLCGLDMPGDNWQDFDMPWEFGTVRPLRPYPGRSCRPLLDGSADTIRREVVIENDDPATGYRVRAMVTSRYRLTIYPGTFEGELFDLKNDPDELINLWDIPQHNATRTELIFQLLQAYSLDTPMYPVPTWNS